MNIEATIRYLDSHATATSHGTCAKAVRLALLAGGLNIDLHPVLAKLYGPYLQRNGFATVSPAGYTPVAGDIVVIQPYPGGNSAGHITMYDGRIWVSDFRQRDMWAGPGYRAYKPPFAIYRAV
jgi:hypothetical protein